MSSAQFWMWGVAAALLFWAVGAHNRLVRLRNDLARAFAPVEAQIQHRRALLQQWLDALHPLIEHSARSLEALQAACGQLQVACEAVHVRPSAARSVASLRLAEETLAEARKRLHTELPAKPELLAGLAVVVLDEELAAADSALGFARRQFNEAAQIYNDALDQFPTWIIAGLFRFRSAGIL